MTLQGQSLRWFGVGIASTMLAVACCEIAVAAGGHRAGGWGLLIYPGVLLAAAAAITNALSVGFGIGAWFAERKICGWMIFSAAVLAGTIKLAVFTFRG